MLLVMVPIAAPIVYPMDTEVVLVLQVELPMTALREYTPIHIVYG